MGYFHMMWSAPLQIAIAIYLLWQQVGAASLAGLGVMVLMIPINGVIAKKVKTLQAAQMQIKDARVKEINEVRDVLTVLHSYSSFCRSSMVSR